MHSTGRTQNIRRKYRRKQHNTEGTVAFTPDQQGNESFQFNVLDLQNTLGNQAVLQMMKSSDVEKPKAKGSPLNLGSFGIASKIPEKSDNSEMAIQRLMANENYYYKEIDKREAITAPVRSFIAKVRTYQLFSKGKVDPDPAAIRTFNQNLRDFIEAARVFNDYAQDRYAVDVGQTDLAGDVKLKCNTRVKQLGKEAVDDATAEMRGFWALRSDPNLVKDMMSWEDAINIKRAGMPLSSMKTGADLVGDGTRQELTGGNASAQVTAMTYNDGSADGKRRVFKPNEARLANVPDGIDVDQEQFNSAGRTVAVSKVEAIIRQKYNEARREFDSMVGKIDFAMDTGTGGTGKFGTVQDMAEGQEGYNIKGSKQYTANIDVSDIKVQQQLANLQLFDMLVGQMDRHMGNVFFKQKAGSASKVSGIDNDFAFSKQTDLTENIGKTSLPEKIDYYFGDALTKISEGELRSAMAGLPEKLMLAAISRLTQIQAIIAAKLEAKELIVSPGDDQLKAQGFPSWDEIDVDSYRDSKFGSDQKDYAGAFAKTRKTAIDSIVKDIVKNGGRTAIAPVKNGNKWELHYDKSSVLVGREADGSDLDEIVQIARLTALTKMSAGMRRRGQRV